MSQAQFNIAQCIKDMPEDARLPGLRKVTNACVAALIGLARKHISEERNMQREGENNDSLDERNEKDTLAAGQAHKDYVTDAMGHKVEDTPMKRAVKMFWVYRWADSACRALSSNQYEDPMTPRSMLTFMGNNTRRMTSEAQLKQFAEALDINYEDLKAIKQKQLDDEKDRLLNDTPRILQFISDVEGVVQEAVKFGYDEEDREDESAVTDLPPLEQHQLLLKLLDGLISGYNSAGDLAVRFMDLDRAGPRPIIKAEILKLYPQIEEFEKLVADDIRAAIEENRRVSLLSDYRGQMRKFTRVNPDTVTE